MWWGSNSYCYWPNREREYKKRSPEVFLFSRDPPEKGNESGQAQGNVNCVNKPMELLPSISWEKRQQLLEKECRSVTFFFFLYLSRKVISLKSNTTNFVKNRLALVKRDYFSSTRPIYNWHQECVNSLLWKWMEKDEMSTTNSLKLKKKKRKTPLRLFSSAAEST